MVITLQKLAEALDVAKNQFTTDFRENNERLIGGFLMVSYLLQAMNLKKSDETIFDAISRLTEKRPDFDLLNKDDRVLLATILKQMFSPLGIKDVVIIGLAGEGKVFITSLHDEGRSLANVDQVKQLLRAVIDSDDTEDFPI